MLIEAIATTPMLGAAWGSRAFRPYVGAVAPAQRANFNLAAKWIAVATGVAPCVHGVVPIVAAKFKRR